MFNDITKFCITVIAICFGLAFAIGALKSAYVSMTVGGPGPGPEATVGRRGPVVPGFGPGGGPTPASQTQPGKAAPVVSIAEKAVPAPAPPPAQAPAPVQVEAPIYLAPTGGYVGQSVQTIHPH